MGPGLMVVPAVPCARAPGQGGKLAGLNPGHSPLVKSCVSVDVLKKIRVPFITSVPHGVSLANSCEGAVCAS